MVPHRRRRTGSPIESTAHCDDGASSPGRHGDFAGIELAATSFPGSQGLRATLTRATARAVGPALARRDLGGDLMLVLLVEDDDRTAHALTDSLRLHRIKVLRAATGAEALAQMSSKVDAVLLDLGLPDGHGSCISA